MTTKERATVQSFINRMTELDKIKDETLKTLKERDFLHWTLNKQKELEAEIEKLERYI